MKKRMYEQPVVDIERIVRGDVLSFSNDTLEFNDEENYLEDNYL